MSSTLERDVRMLKRYAIITTMAGGIALLSAFSRRDQPQSFSEINVERINVVERDGRLRMVISNQARQHPGIVNGKPIARTTARPPGIIFFNHLGDEMGGLIFGENGKIGHFGSFTFDKVRGDQTIGFRHLEGDNGHYSTGIEVWQQPDIPGDLLAERYQAANAITDTAARREAWVALAAADQITRQRLFLGKSRDDDALLLLADRKGRTRIRLVVPDSGDPRIEMLDVSGRVTSSLAPPR